jgi:hypothetical protein
LVGEAGLCAVVPTGIVKAPVALIEAMPESGCKTILPVVSPVEVRAVVVVVPARIVLMFFLL